MLREFFQTPARDASGAQWVLLTVITFTALQLVQLLIRKIEAIIEERESARRLETFVARFSEWRAGPDDADKNDADVDDGDAEQTVDDGDAEQTADDGDETEGQ